MPLPRISAPANPPATIKAALQQAIAQNQTIIDGATTYLAIASPTNLQIAAQVRALTQAVSAIARQLRRLERLAVNQFDGTD